MLIKIIDQLSNCFSISQRSRFLFGVVLFLTFKESESATRATCVNQIVGFHWNGKWNNLRTCFPNVYAVDDEDFTISSTNSSILAVSMRDKKKFEFLPKNLLRTFPELIVFQARSSSLTSVGNEFVGLSKLRFLNLDANKIENVANDAFVDLVNLESLGLAENRIHFLGKNIFASQKALKSLWIENNEIHYLHPKIFRSLVSVELISLGKNDLQSLDENIFESFTSLKDIYLYDNKLKSIAKGLFKKNLKLTKIWLNNNKINFIDANMFDHLADLKFVDLRGNICIKKNYNANSFVTMKTDLKTNCNEIFFQIKLESSIEDLRKLLGEKIREIELLTKNGETKDRKIEYLENKFKELGERIDAVNETSNSVSIMFDG